MKGTSCPHSHSLFGVLRRETLWEVWNVATSKGVLSKLWIYWKLCKPKKKHRFPTTYVPALSRWIEGYWQLKKKHIIISVKGVWPPRFNLDKKGSGKMPASKELKPENPTATALKNFILRKFIGWLRPPFCCCICYSYPTHWWCWWWIFEGIMVFPLDIKEANTKITTWIVWQIQNTPQPASLYLHHK